MANSSSICAQRFSINLNPAGYGLHTEKEFIYLHYDYTNLLGITNLRINPKSAICIKQKFNINYCAYVDGRKTIFLGIVF